MLPVAPFNDRSGSAFGDGFAAPGIWWGPTPILWRGHVEFVAYANQQQQLSAGDWDASDCDDTGAASSHRCSNCRTRTSSCVFFPCSLAKSYALPGRDGCGLAFCSSCLAVHGQVYSLRACPFCAECALDSVSTDATRLDDDHEDEVRRPKTR